MLNVLTTKKRKKKFKNNKKIKDRLSTQFLLGVGH